MWQVGIYGLDGRAFRKGCCKSWQRMSEATRATDVDGMWQWQWQWLWQQPQENPSGAAIKRCVGNAAHTNKSLLL